LTSFSNVSTENQDVVYTKFQRPEKITENGHEGTGFVGRIMTNGKPLFINDLNPIYVSRWWFR
jgi:hypothetical protein